MKIISCFEAIFFISLSFQPKPICSSSNEANILNKEVFHNSIDFSNQFVGAIGATKYADLLRSQLHTNPSKVVLRDCQLGDEGTLAILKVIEEQAGSPEAVPIQNGFTFSFALNGITTAGCRSILLSASRCKRLQHLDLSLNPLGPGGLQPLPALMKDGLFPCASLRLAYCGLGGRDCQTLASALFKAGSNATLTALDLSGNAIGDSGAVSLASALQKGCGLTQLTLRHCKIGDRGAIAIAAALASSNIAKLDISYNKITADGAAAFGRALSQGKSGSLCELNLSNNMLGDDGVRRLAMGLIIVPQTAQQKRTDTKRTPNQRPQQKMSGKGSKVKYERASSATECEDENASADRTNGKKQQLQELMLSNVGMTSVGARGLARALRTNPLLRYLDLSGNPRLGMSKEKKNQSALKETLASVKSLTDDLKGTKVVELLNKGKLTQLCKRFADESAKIGGKFIASYNEKPVDVWKVCGVRCIMRALENNTHLESLELCGSGIKQDIAMDVISALRGDDGNNIPQIKSIDLRMNNLPPEILQTIEDTLKEDRAKRQKKREEQQANLANLKQKKQEPVKQKRKQESDKVFAKEKAGLENLKHKVQAEEQKKQREQNTYGSTFRSWSESDEEDTLLENDDKEIETVDLSNDESDTSASSEGKECESFIPAKTVENEYSLEENEVEFDMLPGKWQEDYELESDYSDPDD